MSEEQIEDCELDPKDNDNRFRVVSGGGNDIIINKDLNLVINKKFKLICGELVLVDFSIEKLDDHT